MSNGHLRRVWRIPLLLAVLTLFGLLAALLGNGIWRVLAWTALAIPLIILIWHLRPDIAPKRSRS